MKKILRNQGLSLLNWMISYYFIACIIATYFWIDPRLTLVVDDTVNKPYWITIVQALLIVVIMFPIWLKLNKWMKVKL